MKNLMYVSIALLLMTILSACHNETKSKELNLDQEKVSQFVSGMKNVQ